MRVVQSLVCLLIIAYLVISCEKDDYIKGYIHTNDIDTTSVTDNTALCSGIIIVDFVGDDVKYSIIQTGIVFSRDIVYIEEVSNNLNFSSDSACVSAQTSEGIFNCLLEKLQPNTNYYIRAYAIINCDYQSNSKTSYKLYGDIKTFTTYNNNFPAPKNLTADQIGYSIILDWNASVDVNLIGSYDIERSNSELGIYTKYGTSNFLTTTFTDTKPFDGMNFYRVKFVGSYSRVSDYAYVSYDYTSPDDNDDKPILSAPSGVSATLLGDIIKVTWNKVQDASDYIIYRSSANGNYEESGRVGNVDNWTDYNPKNGNNCYKVKAFNLYESNFSDADCVYFP